MARNGWRGGYIIATLALFDALALNRLLGSGSIRPRGVHPDAVFRARRPFDYRGRIGTRGGRERWLDGAHRGPLDFGALRAHAGDHPLANRFC